MITAALGLILAIHVQQFDTLRQHIVNEVQWVQVCNRTFATPHWSNAEQYHA